MEDTTISNEKEVLIDIESDEASRGAQKAKKGSLKRFVSGFLSFNGSNIDVEPGDETTTRLLADRNTGGQGNVPLAEKETNETTTENEGRKAAKQKKAPKPPRPPKGPTLDAADMRLLKELAKIAKRKQERVERIKAIKKMKAAKALSTSSSSSSSSSLASSGATISAMFITGFFFLVILLQGLGSSTSSNMTLAGAPQPAPETTGMTPIEFYKIVMSDDGGAPSYLPPKSTG